MMASLNVLLELTILLIVVINSFNCYQHIVDDDPMVDFIFNSPVIYPGTNWCGRGNTAESYYDLGELRDLDMCCREHDLCPDVIHAGGTKHNLTNEAFHTRLSCECDENFWKCLRALDTFGAWFIGNLYFNGLHTKCFKKYYPVKQCAIEEGFFNKRCLWYRYNYSGKKVYQWFDVKEF